MEEMIRKQQHHEIEAQLGEDALVSNAHSRSTGSERCNDGVDLEHIRSTAHAHFRANAGSSVNNGTYIDPTPFAQYLNPSYGYGRKRSSHVRYQEIFGLQQQVGSLASTSTILGCCLLQFSDRSLCTGFLHCIALHR